MRRLVGCSHRRLQKGLICPDTARTHTCQPVVLCQSNVPSQTNHTTVCESIVAATSQLTLPSRSTWRLLPAGVSC